MTGLSDLGRLKNLERSLVDEHLMPYVFEEMPKGLMQREFKAFLFSDNLKEAQVLFESFFIPWFLFNWEDGRVAREYLGLYKKRLSASQIAFCEEMLKSYYSFYQVLGEDLSIEDLLLGTKHRIKKQNNTKELKKGDIVFSRILPFEGDSFFIGMVPWKLTPYRLYIDEFKKDLKEGTSAILRKEELFVGLLKYFFYHRIEGEIIALTKVYFKTPLTREEVLNILRPMTDDWDQEWTEDTLKFNWHRHESEERSTVLGEITVMSGEIVLEVLSEGRAKKGKALIEEYGRGQLLIFKKLDFKF